MPVLNADHYGMREMRLGGAPVTRDQWMAWHGTHDIRTWTVQTDQGSLPHAACRTCSILAVEWLAPGEPPVPARAPTPEPAPEPEPEATTKKGKQK